MPADIGGPGAESPEPVAYGLPSAAKTGRHYPLAGAGRLGQQGVADDLGYVLAPHEEPLREQDRRLLTGPTPRPAGPVPLGPYGQTRRAQTGVPPGPQLSSATWASELPGPQLGLDNPRVVPYDEQSGALQASQRTPSLSAKR